MMDAARTTETSVDNYFTRQYIPEDKSELHTRRRENLKSHLLKVVQPLNIYDNAKFRSPTLTVIWLLLRYKGNFILTFTDVSFRHYFHIDASRIGTTGQTDRQTFVPLIQTHALFGTNNRVPRIGQQT
jgi:hypothetical protein